MTIHLISVGVSLLEALKNPRKTFKQELGLQQAVLNVKPHAVLDTSLTGDKAGAWLAGALAPADDPGHNAAAAEQVAATCGTVTPQRWRPNVCAELDTFDRVPDAGLPLRRDDIAVLIASDTVEGLSSALWNALALTGGMPAKVSYLHTPDRQPSGDVRGHALIVRVPGMDVGTDGGFCEAMGGLGLLGRHLVYGGAAKPREPFRFYLSGGYKAAIPYLIGLAEGLASLPKAIPVDAYVLHERTTSPPIRLPLRTIAPERVTTELRGLTVVPSRSEPDTEFLNGYAYEKTEDGWRLTAFGVGLKTLFGIPPAPGLGG